MSLDPSIILDPEPSYINRIPYKVIENKQHSTYIKKFIKDNKVIKYYVYKQDNIGHVYCIHFRIKKPKVLLIGHIL